MDWDYKNQTGRIFDIQKYSIHDGPGIRTIVFLKGCALRCAWCCNPESQHSGIETMSVNGKKRTVGQDITASDAMDEVLKDLPYFRRSGGGLTLSGGEALLQPAFSSALLRIAKDAGIGTALESAGYADFPVIAERILPWLDLFLLDIKHISPEKHEAFTGRSNQKILENARKIAAYGQHLIVRIPVIPTFNDSEEEILQISNFARTLPGVEQIHLLPYHRLGQDKYAQLDRIYQMPDLRPPSSGRMQELRMAAAQTGLHVQVGG